MTMQGSIGCRNAPLPGSSSELAFALGEIRQDIEGGLDFFCWISTAKTTSWKRTSRRTGPKDSTPSEPG